jgi:hypothetical protein
MESEMPRYYFDFREGDKVATDHEGLEFSTPEQVIEEAARSLADMTKNQLCEDPEKRLSRHLSVDVRDDKGHVLQARFTFELDRLRWSISRLLG